MTPIAILERGEPSEPQSLNKPESYQLANGATPLLSHSHREVQNSKYVVFVDSSRRYVDCSEDVCRLLGYSRAELLKKTIDDISYDVAAVPNLFAQFVASGLMEGEYILQSKAKTPVPIKFKSFVFSDGCKAAVWDPITDWRQPYLSAVMELDRVKLQQKVQIALAAIRQAQASNSQNPREQQALVDALATMNVLSRNAR